MALNINLPTAGLIGVTAVGGESIVADGTSQTFVADSVHVITGSTDTVFELPNPNLPENEGIKNGSVVIFKLKTTGAPTITLRGQEAGGVRVPLEDTDIDYTVSVANTIVTMYYVGEEGGTDWGWIFGPGVVAFGT